MSEHLVDPRLLPTWKALAAEERADLAARIEDLTTTTAEARTVLNGRLSDLAVKPAPEAPRRAPATEPDPASVPTSPKARAREKAPAALVVPDAGAPPKPKRKRGRPRKAEKSQFGTIEKAKPTPAPVVDPTAAALKRLRDPVQALDLATWIRGLEVMIEDTPPEQEPVQAAIAAVMWDAWKLAPAGADDERAQLLGPLAGRLAAAVRLAADVEDDEYGNLLIRAAAHVSPPPTRPWRHTPGSPHRLPAIANADRDHQLPTLRPAFEAGASPQLPLFENLAPSVASVSWLLQLYDAAGGEGSTSGAGPWDLHLWIEAMLHLEHVRRNGYSQPLPVSVKEIKAWMYPDGGWKPSRHDPKLMKALQRVDQLRIDVPGGWWKLVRVDAGIGDTVWFQVRCPPSCANGPAIDTPRLRRYRLESGRVYRAYLSALSYLDRTARNGKAITAGDEDLVRFTGEGFTPDQLCHLVGLDPKAGHSNQDRTVDAFERLAEDEVIDLHREGRDRYRILGVDK